MYDDVTEAELVVDENVGHLEGRAKSPFRSKPVPVQYDKPLRIVVQKEELYHHKNPK
jgi:hypothetical protein